jgi:hypothetical protein
VPGSLVHHKQESSANQLRRSDSPRVGTAAYFSKSLLHSKGLSCSNPPETYPSICKSQHSRRFDSTLFNSCTYCSIKTEQQAGKVTIALRTSHRVDFHPLTPYMPTCPSQPHNHPPLPSDTRNQAKKPPQPTHLILYPTLPTASPVVT